MENRGGAFGVVGADAVAKAPADGYTLLAGSPGPLAVNQHVFKSLPYDPERRPIRIPARNVPISASAT